MANEKDTYDDREPRYGSSVSAPRISSPMLVHTMEKERKPESQDRSDLTAHIPLVYSEPLQDTAQVDLLRRRNSWEEAAINYRPGSRVQGKVRNLTSYGAFVELQEGIDGMVHV